LNTPAVVLINPKSPHNVGKALRAASIFGAKSLVWTGTRVDLSQYDRLPREERMKGYASVAFQVDDRPFDLFPEAIPVCVELLETAECLTTFVHPPNPVYVFGSEDGSVPPVIRRHCHKFVYIPAYHCLNRALPSMSCCMTAWQSGSSPGKNLCFQSLRCCMKTVASAKS
jgi:tRNA(Leu) C34 or U34 (ribose-2'-O)-methylase TrmL